MISYSGWFIIINLIFMFGIFIRNQPKQILGGCRVLSIRHADIFNIWCCLLLAELHRVQLLKRAVEVGISITLGLLRSFLQCFSVFALFYVNDDYIGQAPVVGIHHSLTGQEALRVTCIFRLQSQSDHLVTAVIDSSSVILTSNLRTRGTLVSAVCDQSHLINRRDRDLVLILKLSFNLPSLAGEVAPSVKHYLFLYILIYSYGEFILQMFTDRLSNLFRLFIGPDQKEFNILRGFRLNHF